MLDLQGLNEACCHTCKESVLPVYIPHWLSEASGHFETSFFRLHEGKKGREPEKAMTNS